MKINEEIREYVQQKIIPQYAHFDGAHNLEHVHKVINNSMDIAKDYDVDLDKVYIIAAYHDIGLGKGRENHEKNSSAYLLADRQLKAWFTQDELLLMAEAVEDHRASNDDEPRSLYGKIVSEADRDIEYTTILKRTIQYSLKHYPDFDADQHFARTYEHIRDKYGEGGYLKLWLNTDLNARNLKELREKAASKDTLRHDFDLLFEECRRG